MGYDWRVFVHQQCILQSVLVPMVSPKFGMSHGQVLDEGYDGYDSS
jgi:hypothetical protein